jgi:hypothetical protein
VTPSIGIKADEITEQAALGTDLYAANDHQGALAASRAAPRIKPTSDGALEWLGIVLNA